MAQSSAFFHFRSHLEYGILPSTSFSNNESLLREFTNHHAANCKHILRGALASFSMQDIGVVVDHG